MKRIRRHPGAPLPSLTPSCLALSLSSLFLHTAEPYPRSPSHIAGDWSRPEHIQGHHPLRLVVLCTLVQGIELWSSESSGSSPFSSAPAAAFPASSRAAQALIPRHSCSPVLPFSCSISQTWPFLVRIAGAPSPSSPGAPARRRRALRVEVEEKGTYPFAREWAGPATSGSVLGRAGPFSFFFQWINICFIFLFKLQCRFKSFVINLCVQILWTKICSVPMYFLD